MTTAKDSPMVVFNSDEWEITALGIPEPIVSSSECGSGSTIDSMFSHSYDARADSAVRHCNWHHWYDSTIGKWISDDPIGFSDGPNLHGYVGNSPQIQVDPTGTVKRVASGALHVGGQPLQFSVQWNFELDQEHEFDTIAIQKVVVQGVMKNTGNRKGAIKNKIGSFNMTYYEVIGYAKSGELAVSTFDAQGARQKAETVDTWAFSGVALDKIPARCPNGYVNVTGSVKLYKATPELEKLLFGPDSLWKPFSIYTFSDDLGTTWTAGGFVSYSGKGDPLTGRPGVVIVNENAADQNVHVNWHRNVEAHAGNRASASPAVIIEYTP